MSTLQIRKLESGGFNHVDSIDGDFFLGRFSFKNEFNKAFLVEAYGAKRREYVVTDISVFDFGGSEETFTNFTDLINRLIELNYTGIDTNEIQNFLSNQIGDYPDISLPLLDTDELPVNRSGAWYKVDKSELGGSEDYVTYTTQRAFIDFTNVNEWLCSTAGFQNAQFLGGTQVSCGSGSAPSSNFGLNAVMLPVPTGYIVHEILVNLGYKANNNTNSTVEFFVQREETAGTTQVQTGSNAVTISNDTLSTTTGVTFNMRRYKSLTINAHSLPSLAFSYLQIAIRETQNANLLAFTIQVTFKKA